MSEPKVPCIGCGQLTICTRPLAEYEDFQGVLICRDDHRCTDCLILCAAGRQLREPPGGNPFWAEPCPNPGTDTLILGEPGEPGVEIELCRAHIIALDPERIA